MSSRSAAPEQGNQKTSSRETVLVDLALQGGGAHGAFTWGVFDRLLEEPWLKIDGISGTSAGAMNAVSARGWLCAKGGAEGARAALEAYWRAVSEARTIQSVPAQPLDRDAWALDTRQLATVRDDWTSCRVCSRPTTSIPPGKSAPRNAREARSILKVSSSRRSSCSSRATNVRTGRVRVFRNAEITPEVLMASACLPTMFQAIEIDGESYWDGGYSGNPTHYAAGSRMRFGRHDFDPHQSNRARAARRLVRARSSIRLNEISFNAVAAEGTAHDRAIAPSRRSGDTEGARWAQMRIHWFATTSWVRLAILQSSMQNGRFLSMLQDEGRSAADEFLSASTERYRQAIDVRSRCHSRTGLTMGLWAYSSRSAC